MKKTRFVAVLLCITLLFALFAGSAYAENGVANTKNAYIDNTVLVIKDGKVVSGDKSLVDNGIVVIGDAENADEASEEYAYEETVDDFGTETGDYSTGKESFKDNSDLLTPNGGLPLEETIVNVPEYTPKYIKPNLSYSSANRAMGDYLNFDTQIWSPNTYDLMVMHYAKLVTGTINVNAAQMARGIATTSASSSNSKFTRAFVGEFFRIKSGGNITVQNTGSKNGGLVTLDGLRVYYSVYDVPDNGNSAGTTFLSHVKIWGNWSYSNWEAESPVWFDPIIIQDGGTSTFKETTFQNGLADESGAGVQVNGGTFNMSDGAFKHCKAKGNGGGLYVGASGTAKLTNVVFDGCIAGANGGAIYVASGGKLTLTDVEIKNCSAGYGGAIYTAGNVTLTLTRVSIHNNTAKESATEGNGGAMWIGASSTAISIGAGNKFYSNTAANHGGAIAVARQATLTIAGAEIYSNTARLGGGISCYSAANSGNPKLIINTGKIYGNTATVSGGGVFIRTGAEHQFNNTGSAANDSSIYENTAPMGAGIHVTATTYEGTANGKITITKGKLYGNKAQTGNAQGGGVYVANGGTAVLSGGIIGADSTSNGNKATYGAGVYVASGGAFTISSGELKNNTATSQGGGICSVGGTITISGGTTSGNQASHGGGFNIDTSASMTISGGFITSNTATTGNGGGGWIGAVTKFEMTGGSINGNSAPRTDAEGHGGGLFFNRQVSQTAVAIKGGDIYGNTAAGLGGGIYFGNGGDGTQAFFATLGGVSGKTVNIHTNTAKKGGGICVDDGEAIPAYTTVTINSGVSIYSNTATATADGGMGGGMHISPSGKVTLVGSTINNNNAVIGGGVSIVGGTFNMSGASKINSNTASNQGGGVCASGACVINIEGSATVGDCAVSGNTAGNYGAGFHIVSVSTADNVKIKNTTISNNTATANRGGGMYVSFDSANKDNKLRIENVVFSGNKSETDGGTTDGHGGGIYATNCTLYITDSSFTSNTATYRGGGVYCTTNTVAEVKNCSFTGNSTDSFGGGFHAYSNARATVIGCSFNGNTANYGGALFAVGTDGYPTTLNVVDTTIGTTTKNTAVINGGGICAHPYSAVTIVRGNISNNEAANGGGVYAEDATTTVVITDSTNISGVAATGAGTVISGNKATTGNGGGVCIIGTGESSITNAEIYGNVAPTDTPDTTEDVGYESTGITGNGGGVYIQGAKATLTGCTVGKTGQPNSAVYGGGVAVFRGADVTATNVNVDYNIAIKSGGGYCVLGGGVNDTNAGATVINVSGGSISHNEAQSTVSDEEQNQIAPEIGGGAMYIRGLSTYQEKVVTASVNGVAIVDNKSVRGGGIYLHEAANLTLKNSNNISQNQATQLGGAFFMIKGASTADIDNCVFTENSAGLRGGGLYIQVNGCTVSNTQMMGNKANGLSWGGGGKGGAIYVKTPTELQTSVELPLTNVDFTRNEAEYGGAICAADGAHPIIITLNASANGDACHFEGNIAKKNGGAILVSGTGASVTMTNGFVINNQAGTTASTASPYQAAYTATDGVGGGIAIFDGGSFSLTGSNIAIYGNTAATAGDDVFANGKNTQLTIPAPTAMNTTGYGKDGAVWWEDYMSDDANYSYGLNGEPRVVERYDLTPISIRAYTTSAEGASPSGRYINDAGRYVAISFDVQKYNMGSIKITAPEATDENQRFVFTVSGTTTLDDVVNFTISLPAGESVTIAKLLPGSYTVTMQDGWSWRYTLNGATLGGASAGDGSGTIEVTVTGLEVDELHEVEYSASRTVPYWLDHNSPIRTNTATQVAARIDMAEAKRNII